MLQRGRESPGRWDRGKKTKIGREGKENEHTSKKGRPDFVVLIICGEAWGEAFSGMGERGCMHPVDKPTDAVRSSQSQRSASVSVDGRVRAGMAALD
jgi:hypothetical protein